MTDTTSPAQPFKAINGVYTVPIRVFTDERGQFLETFRKAWFPQMSWEQLQSNRSDSKAGALRGLHYHLHQVDYWYVPRGAIRVGLADLRRSSPTYRVATTLELREDVPMGLFIPIGVAHGFYTADGCTLLYTVNQYYDGGADEHGVLWNDPTLNLDWHLEGTPLLSQRDQQNALLSDIPQDRLPE